MVREKKGYGAESLSSTVWR